jgi:ribosomal protein S18
MTYSKSKYKGFIKELGEMKYGLIQGTLWTKPQDLSGRSTITVEPSLGLDQVGVPKEMAYTLYKPFIMQEMKASGIKASDTKKYYDSKDPLAWNALQQVVDRHPIIINRAPSLHKHSVQAFQPVLVDGKAIKLNPLVNSGFNADYDGDSISAYITITYRFDLIQNLAENYFKNKNKDILEKNEKNLDFDKIIDYICNININQSLKDMLKNAYIIYKNTKQNITKNIHIKDFPHLNEITKENETVVDYKVPEFIEVFALENGKIVSKAVTNFSVHKNLKMFKVTTKSKKEVIASEDHSLICFNPETSLVEKMKPADSINRLTPIPAALEINSSNI